MYESLKCWSFGTFFFEVIQLLIRHFHHARNIPRKNSSKHTYKDPLLAWEFSTRAECNSFDSQISYQIIFKWNIRQSQYRISSLKIIQFSSNVKIYFVRPFHFYQQERCVRSGLRRPRRVTETQSSNEIETLETTESVNKILWFYWLIWKTKSADEVIPLSDWLIYFRARAFILSMNESAFSKNFRQEKSWHLNRDKFIYSIAIFLRNFEKNVWYCSRVHFCYYITIQG